MSTETGVLDRSAGTQPARGTPAREMRIEVTSDLDVAALRYQELDAGGVMSAFQTRLWIECWAAQLARPRGAEVLFCSVRSGDGQPVMLLPLCRRVDGRLRVIEGTDLGVSDYIAPVMAPGFRPTPAEWAALWPRIVAALPPHDLLRLTKIPLVIGGEANPLAWIPGCLALELQAHGVAVSAPWEACTKRIFSGNRREKLKKGWRGLAGLGSVRFRVVEEAAEMTELFEQLAAQRLRRFAALQRNDPLRDPDFANFYRAIIARGAASGFARLALLEVDDRMVAMLFGVCHGGAFHLLIPTFFDGPWSQLAPGMLLSARMMQWSAESGLTYYDFTIGNEDYKGRLGATAHDLVEVVSAGSWRGLPTVAAVRLKAWIKRQPWLLAAIRKAKTIAGR